MVAREHVEAVIAAFCAAETAGDRDAWLALFACHVGRGAQRIVLDRAVDHFEFDDAGRVGAVRAFVDMAATRPDPE